jgi:hypothetical protein
MHENKTSNDLFLVEQSSEKSMSPVEKRDAGAHLSELLFLRGRCFRERIWELTEDAGLFEELVALSTGLSPFFTALVWVGIKSRSSSFEAIENLDKCLKLCSARVHGAMSEEEQMWMVQVLEGIEEMGRQGSLGCCKDAALDFLFRAFLKSSSAVNTTKAFALSLFIKTRGCIEREDIERLLLEFGDLDEFITNGVRFRETVLLRFFSHFVFRCSEFVQQNHEFFIEAFLRPCFLSDSATCIRNSICCCASLMDRDAYAKILCTSFVLLFSSEFKEEPREGIVHALGVILNNLLLCPGEDNSRLLERAFGKPASFVLKIARSLFFYLFGLMNRKKHPSRTTAARALGSAELRSLSLGRKMVAQITRLCRKNISEKQATLVDAAIKMLCRINADGLLAELRRPHPLSTKRKMFDQVKDRTDDNCLYQTYLELLSSDLTRDVEFEVKDLRKLSGALYGHSQKDVIKHVDIEIDSIEDLCMAELALFYSRHHPGRVDEVYVASLLLENGGEIIKSRNIAFYNRILEILISLSASISAMLRRRVVNLLRRLVFYSPYTRNAGMLMNVLGGSIVDLSKKNDFIIVVYGAVGCPRFRDILSEYPWSPNKELGLLYYLRFDPSLGITYRWKLEEVIERAADCAGKEPPAVAELFLFLRQLLERDIPDFYFGLIARSHSRIISGVEHPDKHVSREASLLLKSATDTRAILPHLSIPYIFSHHSVLPEYMHIYGDAVLNTMKETVEAKLRMFERSKAVTELRMVYEIYKHATDKTAVVERLAKLLDESPLRTYYLLAQAMLFDRKNRLMIFDAAESNLHMCGASNRLLPKILTLFLDAKGSSRRCLLRLRDEGILFDDSPTEDEIDALTLEPGTMRR